MKNPDCQRRSGFFSEELGAGREEFRVENLELNFSGRALKKSTDILHIAHAARFMVENAPELIGKAVDHSFFIWQNDSLKEYQKLT